MCPVFWPLAAFGAAVLAVALPLLLSGCFLGRPCPPG